jgi:hypothetical protein
MPVKMKQVSLPYLRIEYSDYATNPQHTSLKGFAYLVLGQTVIQEAPMDLYPQVEKQACKIRRELLNLRVQIDRVLVDVKVPESINPVVLWYPWKEQT